jgi:hypothetical protein
VRTFRRWCHRFEEAGESRLFERRLGKASAKRIRAEQEHEVEAEYWTRYSGFAAR